MNLDNKGIKIANFPSSSSDGKELRENLYATAKKPLRTVLTGKVYIVKVRIYGSFGEDAFDVSIELAPKLHPSVAPSFTAKQGQYLAYIHSYTKIHRQAPAESDLQRHFRVSPPAIHDMIKALERNGFIESARAHSRAARRMQESPLQAASA
jgi:repressor LexA